MRIHVAFCIAVLGACGSGGDPGDDTGPDAAVSALCLEATSHDDLAWIQTNVFSRSCTFSSCHAGNAAEANNLSLDPGRSHAELVGQAAVSNPGMMLVSPGNPNSSYLLVAIGAVAGQLPEDGMMPLNSPALCPEKQQAIVRWIQAGAVE